MDSPALRETLSQSLPDYMIPSYFVQLDNIPLTPNKKVNRNALPAPVMEKEKNSSTAPDTQPAKKLARLWAHLLGIEVEKIQLNSNFFHLGGHSLKATILISRMHREFNVRITLADIFQNPTLDALAQYAGAQEKDKWHDIQPIEKMEHYPLSAAQERLFIVDKIDGPNTVYNLPGAWILEGDPDVKKLEKALRQMTKRHESLRTSFHMRGNKAVQVIEEEVRLSIQYTPGETLDPEDQKGILQRITDFIKPFDLSRAPLLKVALIRLDNRRHLMLFDMHHIISDGVTMGILAKETIGLYEDKELPELYVQYKDYARWQNRYFQSESFENQENYWLEVFKDGVPDLHMPLDYPRPAVRSTEGAKHCSTINKETAARLNRCALETGTTLYMMLSAIYNILLSKYTGREDIVVGLPSAGRKHADLESIIG
ncbi:MAG: non-ribosomal peptide synthetase, partial [bacterium]|nr:non-ribosomal peptide synthetase [bacterium]